jgi:hypothetical protein
MFFFTAGFVAVRRHVADHQRIAVRMCTRCRLRSDRSAGTCLVVDDEGRAKRSAQPLRDDPRHQIDASTRRLRRDDLDRRLG